MKTKNFIEKALRRETRVVRCSNVFQEVTSEGVTLYSYGPHYPLVRIIGGKAFVNTRGYSQSTGRHISWAFCAAANIVGWDNVFHSPLYTNGTFNLVNIKAYAESERDRLDRQMNAKKRTNTRVYEWLEIQRDRMTDTLNAVKELA